MIPIVASLLGTLAQNGLGLLSSAIQAKGKEVVENALGVKISDNPTDAEVAKLRQLQYDHEERLLELGIEKARIEQESARRMEAAYPTNSLSTNSLLSRATGRPAYEFARSDERTASVLAQSERAGQRVQQSRERNADFIRGNREYLQGLGQPARRPLFREFVEYYKNVLIF